LRFEVGADLKEVLALRIFPATEGFPRVVADFDFDRVILTFKLQISLANGTRLDELWTCSGQGRG